MSGFRRWRRWLLLVLLLIGLVGGLTLFLSEPQTPYDSIQLGMTEAEVCELMGGPPGTYSKRLGHWTVVAPQEPYARSISWITEEDDCVHVFLDEDGWVMAKRHNGPRPSGGIGYWVYILRLQLKALWPW